MEPKVLSNHIEAILFIAGHPVTISRLVKIFDKSEKEIKNAITELEINLENRGICLIISQKSVTLGTAHGSSEYCESLVKEELNKVIGKAGLETLAMVLYKNKITRAEIDYVRGVNSSFTLRNLTIRGLVKRETNPKDKRSFVYTSSAELLQYLGITKIENLPNFEEFKKQLDETIKESINEKITDSN